MNHYERMVHLDRFIAFEAVPPVSAEQYQAERPEWLVAIQDCHARGMFDDHYGAGVSIALDVYRDEPWPWVRDLLGEMTGAQTVELVRMANARAPIILAMKPLAADFKRRPALDYGAQMALLRVALKWDLRVQAKCIATAGHRWHNVVRTLLRDSGPEGPASLIDQMVHAGIRRYDLLKAVIYGSRCDNDEPTRGYKIGFRELLEAVSNAPPSDLHTLLPVVESWVRQLHGMIIRSSGTSHYQMYEEAENFRESLASRIKLKSAVVSAPTMAAP